MSEQKFGLREFAAKHGLTIGKHCCYGVYGGYRVHVKYRAMANPACLLTVVTDTKGRNLDLEKYLEKHKKELKLTAYGVVGIGLMASPQLYAGVFRQVETILDKIVAYLKRAGFPGADVCPYCGKPLGEDRVSMVESGIPFEAHAACYGGAYAAAVKREEAQRSAPAHRLRGIAGAVAGALVAAMLFVLLFIWWDFAALAAAAGTLLGGWLYCKCGGKNDGFRVAFTAGLTLLVLLVTYALCLYFEVSLSGYTGSVFAKIAADLQGDADYRGAFLLNVIFLVVFDLIGTSYNLFSCLRARKKISANMSRADG